ncbi:MAG: iron-containing redox enzyme family protein [bacterium]|nr:iron-containing redox enzyme family protein [bacterium]
MAASSLSLTKQGEPEEFIEALIDEITLHPALHHPYLVRLAMGRLPNMTAAVQDYAFQYSFYSDWFVRYLAAVIQNLKCEEQKEALLENLEEEQGDPNSEKLEERPHVEIFADFKQRIGIDDAYLKSNQPSTTVMIWRDLFLQKCRSDIEGVGLGAIGLATEFIVPQIYPHLIDAIEKHTDFDNKTSLFFRLHVECDVEHADEIAQVTTIMARDIEKREAIRFGVFSALNLRAAFWDSQLARATCQ